MVQLNPDAYLSLDESAKKLHVPEYYLLEVLEQYGISPRLREVLGKDISIRAGDLRGLGRRIKEETEQRGAA